MALRHSPVSGDYLKRAQSACQFACLERREPQIRNSSLTFSNEARLLCSHSGDSDLGSEQPWVECGPRAPTKQPDRVLRVLGVHEEARRGAGTLAAIEGAEAYAKAKGAALDLST
jgi:hypothetical protein